MKKLNLLFVRQLSPELFANKKQFQILSQLSQLNNLGTFFLTIDDMPKLESIQRLPNSLEEVYIEKGRITLKNLPENLRTKLFKGELPISDIKSFKSSVFQQSYTTDVNIKNK